MGDLSMKSVAIIGAQWGDEGKGKITDLLSKKCDVVCRYQGGNNAGHTIIVGNKKTVLHLIPSGILHPHAVSVIGHGVVLDPEAFHKELNELKEAKVSVTPENLKVSLNTTVITMYHRLLDGLREAKGPVKIGTTGKGIGPAYEDKVGRKAVKVSDLLDRNLLIKKLTGLMQEKEILFKVLYDAHYPTILEEADRLFNLGREITPFACDTFSFLDRASSEGKKILYEGAQGLLLDIDYGTYPFVTSSNTSVGGAFTGAGVFGRIDEVLGICKAYTTRVGEGPFPTELHTEIGETIQKKGHEFGATTGRKRRCGWLDLPLIRYAIKSSNLTSIALTKLDVLSDLNELKVCYAYEYNGERIDCAYPGIDLLKAKPLFKEFKPFTDTFNEKIHSKELTDYLNFIEKEIKIPIGMIAYGPEREQIQFRKDYFNS